VTTTDTTHPVAVAATRIASQYPLLLNIAGSIKAQVSGTIGRTGNVHGIPGGTEHHNLTREVRDALWGYAEVIHDVRELGSDVYSNAVLDNARKVAAHADALDQADALPCPVEHRPAGAPADWQDTPAAHLACIERRVRAVVEPKGAREYVGLCPTDGCPHHLRAPEHGPVRCVDGHVHDTATVRDVAVKEASERLHTLMDISRLSLTLWGRRVKYEALKKMVRSGRLASTTDITGKHLVRASDVAAVLIHGKR